MTTWDDAAAEYLAMVRDPTVGFNDLAGDVALELLGDVSSRTVLDIGCGEGSFARRLAGLGAAVVAVEPTLALLDAASAHEDGAPLGIRYHPDRAEELAHVASDSVDDAVALLVLHHVGDLSAALSSAHRVLRAEGALTIVVPHPCTDHPGATWHAVDGRAARVFGDYAAEGYWRTDEVGSIRSVGWHHRTIASWIDALAAAHFAVERVREPLGAEPRRPDGGGPWSTVPRFLALRARRAAV